MPEATGQAPSGGRCGDAWSKRREWTWPATVRVAGAAVVVGIHATVAISWISTILLASRVRWRDDPDLGPFDWLTAYGEPSDPKQRRAQARGAGSADAGRRAVGAAQSRRWMPPHRRDRSVGRPRVP